MGCACMCRGDLLREGEGTATCSIKGTSRKYSAERQSLRIGQNFWHYGDMKGERGIGKDGKWDIGTNCTQYKTYAGKKKNTSKKKDCGTNKIRCQITVLL